MRTSAVLAVRDEEAMIEGALRSVAFCDECIVIVDDRTTDRTAELARRHTSEVHVVPFAGFAAFKNEGVSRARGEWIVFCDGDERVTHELARQFLTEVDRGTPAWAFRTPTVNFFYGKRMDHGGWRETHIKIVRRELALHEGDVHERLAIPDAHVGWLPGERWHFSHRSFTDNLRKTMIYGQLDAEERFAAGAPEVTVGTLLKIMGLEFLRRMVRRAGWRDGMPGFLESVYQPFGLFCTWAMLWERQNRTRIAEAYAQLEREAAGPG